MTYGAIQLPSALWESLSPGAQSAITLHNNTLNLGAITPQANNAAQAAHMMNQMSNSTQQVYGPAQNNQFQQVNATQCHDTGSGVVGRGQLAINCPRLGRSLFVPRNR